MTWRDLLYPVARGTIFVALLLIIGTQTAMALVRSALADTVELAAPLQDRLRRLVRPVLLGLVCLLIAKAALQLLSFVDPGETITFALAKSVLLSGTWGISWLVQFTAVVIFLVVGARRPGTAAALTGLLVVAQTGMGHAAGATWPTPLGRIVDASHLLGAGIWLGTLAALAVAAFPSLHGEERLPSLARVVRDFSLYARIGVSLVIVSGVIAGLRYVGPIAVIAQSAWGRLLLFKLAGMLGVMVLGWYNWRIVTPALDGGHAKARHQLRFAVRFELMLGLVMLALTAFLVATALPGEG